MTRSIQQIAKIHMYIRKLKQSISYKDGKTKLEDTKKWLAWLNICTVPSTLENSDRVHPKISLI